MASSVAITLNENNDENVNFAITTNVPTVGTVLNLSGLTVEVYLKPSATTVDTDGAVWKGSTATGEVTITDAPNGLCTVSIPAATVQDTKRWYRCDVISSGKRKTAVYGNVTVVDM